MNFGGMIAKVCDAPRVPTASALQARHAPRVPTASALQARHAPRVPTASALQARRAPRAATPRPRYLSRRRLGQGGSEAAFHGYRK